MRIARVFYSIRSIHSANELLQYQLSQLRVRRIKHFLACWDKLYIASFQILLENLLCTLKNAWLTKKN